MLAKFLSRKFLLALAALVLGILAQAGIVVPEALSSQIIGAVVEVAALVSYLIANVAQKKTQ